MPTTVQTLDQRLQALEDRAAIQDLIASYGPLADCGDSAALASLWCADGEYAIAGFATAKGHAEIAALIDGPHHRALMAGGCAHVLGPVMIELAGDSATARGHSIVLRQTADGFEAHRVAANHWRLIRTTDGWRVVHRANALLDGSAAARMLLAPSGPAQPAI